MEQKTAAKKRWSTEKRKKVFLDAFRNNLGIITHTCDAVDVNRSTFYRWQAEDLDFAAQLNEIDEYQIDFLENALFKRVKEGDTTAIIFGLKCKGKKRGWMEKSILGVEGALDLKISPEEQAIYDNADIEQLEKIKEIVKER